MRMSEVATRMNSECLMALNQSGLPELEEWKQHPAHVIHTPAEHAWTQMLFKASSAVKSLPKITQGMTITGSEYIVKVMKWSETENVPTLRDLYQVLINKEHVYKNPADASLFESKIAPRTGSPVLAYLFGTTPGPKVGTFEMVTRFVCLCLFIANHNMPKGVGGHKLQEFFETPWAIDGQRVSMSNTVATLIMRMESMRNQTAESVMMHVETKITLLLMEILHPQQDKVKERIDKTKAKVWSRHPDAEPAELLREVASDVDKYAPIYTKHLKASDSGKAASPGAITANRTSRSYNPPHNYSNITWEDEEEQMSANEGIGLLPYSYSEDEQPGNVMYIQASDDLDGSRIMNIYGHEDPEMCAICLKAVSDPSHRVDTSGVVHCPFASISYSDQNFGYNLRRVISQMVNAEVGQAPLFEWYEKLKVHGALRYYTPPQLEAFHQSLMWTLGQYVNNGYQFPMSQPAGSYGGRGTGGRFTPNENNRQGGGGRGFGYGPGAGRGRTSYTGSPMASDARRFSPQPMMARTANPAPARPVGNGPNINDNSNPTTAFANTTVRFAVDSVQE